MRPPQFLLLKQIPKQPLQLIGPAKRLIREQRIQRLTPLNRSSNHN